MTEQMIKAVGFYEGLPLDEPQSFLDERVPMPMLRPHDILVKVKAVSVNPVDTKLRQTTAKQMELKVLGFDAAGEVAAVGSGAAKFKVGDKVFYAGTTTRAGSNQEFQAVDERIVALAPQGLSAAEAAALPLTALTAYELLFDKFGLVPQEGGIRGKSILVINGAGGVGSLLTQLAAWAGLEVLATASPQNFAWLRKFGTTHPLDYHQDLAQAMAAVGFRQVDHIAVLFDITRYFDQIKYLVKPFGHVGTIVGIDQPLEVGVWKNQAISFDWEYMFAKTDHDYQIATQGEALAVIAHLAETGKIKSTVTKSYSEGINGQTLKQATRDVETGHMQGKVVVSGPFNG